MTSSAARSFCIAARSFTMLSKGSCPPINRLRLCVHAAPASAKPQAADSEVRRHDDRIGTTQSTRSSSKTSRSAFTSSSWPRFAGFHSSRVPPLLHTPLMSATNAISGISLIGSIVVAGAGRSWASTILGFLAVACSSVNVFGGFLITDRMLRMFREGKRLAKRSFSLND